MSSRHATQVACDVKDLALADLGKRRIEWAVQSMPVLQTIRKQFIKTQPLAGHPRRRLPARDHRDREPDDHAARRRRQRSCCARRIRSRRRTTWRPRWCATTASRRSPSRARTTMSTIRTSIAALDHKPQITMDDGADLVTLLHTKRKDLLAGRDRRHRRDHHRRDPPARHGEGRRAARIRSSR